MKRKHKISIATLFVSGILFLITLAIGFSLNSAGGLNIRYLPFPVFKICVQCISEVGPIWWGIIVSTIFWLILIEIIHRIMNKALK
jgi:hypothetical protein